MNDSPASLFDLSGKIALVTGASSGLGSHFAGVLAAAGARVVCCARRVDLIEARAMAIRSAGGEAIHAFLDVTNAAAVAAAFDAAQNAFGTVNLVVNNAGIAVSRPALDMDEAEAQRVFDTDLAGPWRVAVEAARRMTAAAAAGSIVNIGSILADRTAVGVAPYAAAKAGLVQMTRTLALEWARHGIRVNALNPGYVETDLNRSFFASEAGQRMVRRIPQRRLGRPDDLDGALLLLASDAGRHMTGAVVTVDGGHSLGGL